MPWSASDTHFPPRLSAVTDTAALLPDSSPFHPSTLIPYASLRAFVLSPWSASCVSTLCFKLTPSPPPLKGSPKEALKDNSPEKVSADDDAEIEQAVEEGSKTDEILTKAKVKTKSHVLGAFKGIGKKMAGFRGDVAVDGNQRVSIKERIGAKIDKTVFQGGVEDHGEIDTFPAKLDGTSGYIVLENRNDVLPAPQISFVPASGTKEQFVWPIDDIVEIKKSHVTATRLALGWVSGAEVEGLGLTIRFKTPEQMLIDQNKPAAEAREDGTVHAFTKVARREQLFVRLVSMGAQRWEVL